ncbi:MAG: antitoxin Xre/MbcA/ParS toxin-binding domain-containing protein [Ornithinimicrobium sp.]|uniref:antitoxin Xre/MbcA/ParS toxin-binding domain-containing protein n=1 Tax=Ornithinimicrobium sp. TaxID=1977084 RepID=UPI003D9B9506
MLGVNASQTSRWASGQEQPGALTAPLLIDLEHVLARARLVWAEPAASVWIDSANAHLGGATPADVLRLEGVGPVLRAVDAAAWGSGA